MRVGVAQRPGPELNLGPHGPELAEKGAEASLCGAPSLAASCLCALPPAEAPSQQHFNHVCVTKSFRRVRLCDPMDHSPSAPLCMRRSRQERCSGLPRSPAGGLPEGGIQPTSCTSRALAAGFFTTSDTCEVLG